MKKFTISLGFVVLGFILFWQSLFLIDFSKQGPPMRFGVTFSAAHASYLGNDPKDVFNAIINDLNVKLLRLGAYWNVIEANPGQYDFSQLDYYMNEAAKNDIKVTLAIGRRLPHWPECHDPVWVESLNNEQKESKILKLMQATVLRYKDHPALLRWQVENEPFLTAFGECPKVSRKMLKDKILMVKNLDPGHEVMTTDSGELSTWFRTAPLVDIFGSTVYRIVFSPYLGYISHEPSIPPAQYRIKAWLVGKPTSKVVLSEIQAEAWPMGDLRLTPVIQQLESMDIARFKRTVEFSKKTGFSEGYLWGVEWWYWLRGQGHPEFWDYAEGLF